MKLDKNFLFILFISFIAIFNPVLGIQYHTIIQGVDNKEINSLLTKTSQLIALQDTDIATLTGLKRRADKDVPNLVKVLHSLGYYGAKVEISFDPHIESDPVLVTIKIIQGPVYPLASFQVITLQDPAIPPPFLPTAPAIKERHLGILIGEPATPKSIIEAENALIKRLEEKGYPLAKIAKRDVIADQATKTIAVTLHVDNGPLAGFGKTAITGNKKVKDLFFDRKIAWKEGSKYDPDKIAKTITTLEASGLFSSINIRYDETLDENNLLPMTITVTEAKHRSIGFGLNYDTDLGPGLNAEWENRNLRGLGEKISFVTNIWLKKKEGTLRYIKPDFYHPQQDLIWTAEAINLETRGFDESSLSLSAIIERQFNDHIRFSYGGMFKRLRNWDSDNNGSFNLFKTPMQFMWHKTNSLLDPTQGTSVLIKSTPTIQTMSPQSAYIINTASASAYLPLRKDKRIVLAGKTTFGSIWGADSHDIPPSERFYAGSDNLLRGYRYLSVSPLNFENKPIGGRSMMIGSLEMRMRVSETLGFVSFWDIGNVYASPFPKFNHKQLQSIGIGARYHTPAGPLRLDIAFPLNPRKDVDNKFQVYFSIGQAF